MRPTSYFNASHDIAVRSGVIAHRYRTADGRFILNEDDMRHVRLLPAEYSTGIDAIPITESEAAELIAAGGNQLGEMTNSSGDASAADSDAVQTEAEDGASPEDTPSFQESVDAQESESSAEEEAAVDEGQDGSPEDDPEDPSTQQDEP